MAADQERAERIRALKQERPDLTWRRIADHVGVTERSATDWQKKGGIEYDNAKKLAALFEVDVDYIWRGTSSPTPFVQADADADQLDRIEARLEKIEALLGDFFKARTQQAGDIISRLESLEEALTARVDESAEKLDAHVAQVERALRAVPAKRPATKRKTAPTRNPAA